MEVTDVETDMIYTVESVHNTEDELLAWMKEKADAEYAAKGFSILGFSVISVSVESTQLPAHRSLGAFFHGRRHAKHAATETVRARVKVRKLHSVIF